MERLAGAAPGASLSLGALSPRAILARGAGDLRRLPGADRAWIVMEEGAQLIALAAGARPGERVLDACAGHGNKTWILGHEVEPTGAVDAADRYAHKLANLRAGPAGAVVRETYALDWTDAGTAGRVPPEYDAVLVDAPCSGLGTLRRRPEIARRRALHDLTRLGELELAITRRAALHVRDGGRLLYTVCSVLREEAEEVVANLVKDDELGVHLEPAPFGSELAQQLANGATTFRLLPHVHGTDGYFAASFTVRRGGRRE
jgi:16S rRNA (cytosine967-C5)-methyltransferase